MLCRAVVGLCLLGLSGCLFVPEHEAEVSFQYILLHRDVSGVIGALLCDSDNVGQVQPFLNSRVSRIVVIGSSARGITVTREADCFYVPNNANIDTPEELGVISFTLPADTYNRLELRIFDKNGTPMVWATDADGSFGEAINILGSEFITLTPGGELDLGNLFIRQGLTSQVVDKELRIFPEFP